MGITDDVELTTISDDEYMLWAPGHFKAYQLRDYLDFRAALGTGDVTILRLLANRDVHIYGVLLLRNPAIRSFETMIFNCVSGSDDIASFCSGGAGQENTEKMRITKDGDVTLEGDVRGLGMAGLTLSAENRNDVYKDLTLQGAKLLLETWNGSVSALQRWGSLEFVSGLRTLKVNDGPVYKTLVAASEKVHFDAWNSAASPSPALQRWGSIEFESVYGERTLKGHDGSNDKSLTLQGMKVVAKGTATDDFIFLVKNSANSIRMALSDSGDVLRVHGHNVTVDQAVNLSALAGGNMATVPDMNTNAGALVVHYFDITSNTSADHDITIERKIRILDAVVVKRDAAGTPGDSVRLKNGSDAITDAIDLVGPPAANHRPTSIYDAYSTVSASGTLRATTLKGGTDVRCEVYVIAMRVA